MNKQDFLALLRRKLSGLPPDDVEERLAFYREMIDDRMEDGLSEDAAVAELGPVEHIMAQIMAETPLTRLVRERIKPSRHLQAWELVLLILGFPVWLPLLIAAFAALLSVYVVIWAAVVSLWAADASFAAGSLGGLAAGILSLCRGSGAQGWIAISAALVLAGLTIFLFFGDRAVTGGVCRLTKRIAVGVKTMFLRKETAE